MYTNEDLNLAIQKGIFTESSVEDFRQMMANLKQTTSVDEENFKLIGGFNDVFIVIACSLLLFSSYWLIDYIGSSKALGFAGFAVIAWGLAEYFILKRRMALPAILLLFAFVGGVFGAAFNIIPDKEAYYYIPAGLSVAAAYGHWLRFKVPVTVAIGTGSAILFLLFLIGHFFPETEQWLTAFLLSCGVLTFALAMYWDSSDRRRVTSNSDVAFWLHLLSAPLIIHPVFLTLGMLDGKEALSGMISILLLYLVMTSLSIIIDRRAFMVSSSAYVLYALSSILNDYGNLTYSFSLTGVLIGSALLLLSAWWHPTRAKLVSQLPVSLQQVLPAIKSPEQ